jgi:hypothetical protein
MVEEILLAFCFYYFLVNEAGYDEEAITRKLEFPPFYQELLQAFSLTIPRSYEAEPFSREVSKFRKGFKEMGDFVTGVFIEIKVSRRMPATCLIACSLNFQSNCPFLSSLFLKFPISWL